MDNQREGGNGVALLSLTQRGDKVVDAPRRRESPFRQREE